MYVEGDDEQDRAPGDNDESGGEQADPPKLKFEPIRSGHKANPLTLPIPPRFVAVIQRLEYISYTSITLSNRRRATFAPALESSLLSELSSLLAKPVDRHDDRNISMQDWCGAAAAVERETRKLHGDARADALLAHHQNVIGISQTHSWQVAVEYDIQQRELAFMDKAHDYSSVDGNALSIIATKITLQSVKELQAHSFRPPKRRLGEDSNHSAQSPKKPRVVTCFRCGLAGHLPAECSASVTTAGKPVASLIPNARTLPPATSASLPPIAPMPMHAASAAAPPMVQGTVGSEPDPRQVVTPIDPVKTRALLARLGILDKWQHILEGLEAGFDVGLRLDPDFISTYIQSEEAAGRYSRAFLPEELEKLIGPFRTSPIGLVPKPGSSKFRMIQDLSFPRNHPSTPSVNSLINPDDFPTAWGSFEATAKLVLSLPPGCVAATFDIKSAYRLTPIRPSQQNWTCVAWNGRVWVDRVVMFGMSSSAGVFGGVADMLVDIYETAEFGPISKWVDDFFVIRLPHCVWSEAEFINLTAVLGVPWSMEKLRNFAVVQRYIGFNWHLDKKAVSFPQEKREKLIVLLKSWLEPGARFTAKEAASLHGNSFQVAPSKTLATKLSSKMCPEHSPPATAAPAMHATAAARASGLVGCHWEVWRWAPGVKVGPKQQHDIGWAEAVAVELGLRMVVALGLARSSRFLVRSDNKGVVAIVNKGWSRSIVSNAVIQSTFSLLAAQGMTLKAVHVTSRENIADALSRGDIEAFLRGFPAATSLLNLSHTPPPAVFSDVTLSHSSSPVNAATLRPPCRADERIFRWTGVNTPPPATINNPVLQMLTDAASRASLRDAGAYGAGLRKFHIFCDIFDIAEELRLPAPFHILHSFAVWAASDPDSINPDLKSICHFEPVAVSTVRKYLSAIRAWHIAQGWPEPLTQSDLIRIDWSLQGLERIMPRRKRPPRPPVTIKLLRVMRGALNLAEPFDACIWAMATCAFWGIMRFGEVSYPSSRTFDGSKHLKRCDVTFDEDTNGVPYARLNLPCAKTAKPGEIQQVFLATQEPEVCALEALANLAKVVPAKKEDPLFSWSDRFGKVRPMAKEAALKKINSISKEAGLGETFGHSFRIGGASYFLAKKVDPEILRASHQPAHRQYFEPLRAVGLASRRAAPNLLSDMPILKLSSSSQCRRSWIHLVEYLPLNPPKHSDDPGDVTTAGFQVIHPPQADLCISLPKPPPGLDIRYLQGTRRVPERLYRNSRAEDSHSFGIPAKNTSTLLAFSAFTWLKRSGDFTQMAGCFKGCDTLGPASYLNYRAQADKMVILHERPAQQEDGKGRVEESTECKE
ncbi:hypothetical protein NP233_g10660 [Leucocoprinus birnbaumii]|uniref:CCHC-type domain-containing protein n=1 Tax=Leucocoprinus birnbaumii TaxID=56174 RepID=A0AAD5YPM2_9AGAR|nr:hypothetical protein NP233_g10660 [Leucocoprinus birnbaumii]